MLPFTGHFVRGCLNSDASKGCKVTDKTAQWITNVRYSVRFIDCTLVKEFIIIHDIITNFGYGFLSGSKDRIDYIYNECSEGSMPTTIT